MKIKLLFHKFLVAIVLVVGLGILVQPEKASARCWVTNGPEFHCGWATRDDNCNTIGSGAAGFAVYGYDYYGNPDFCWGYFSQSYSCDTTCGGPGTPGYCFVPGTLVGNSSGGKPIEDIKVGDKVESFKDDKVVESVVSEIFKVTRDYYYKLVAGDYEVGVTAEHPFYVGGDKFEQVQNLKAGDDVYVMESRNSSSIISWYTCSIFETTNNQVKIIF